MTDENHAAKTNPAASRALLDAMGVDQWVRRSLPRDTHDAVEITADVSSQESAETPASVEVESPPSAIPPDSAETPATADFPALARMVANCTHCELSQSRTNTVFGVGNPDADWLFVGEAPGREEDKRGEPFVGRAGQLLDSILFSIDLKRDDVYIANVLKCRPPANRDPMGEEVVRCEPYLHRQVDLVKPRIIIAMGRFAAQSLLRSNEAISKLRGQSFSYRDTGLPLIVTYHPAYLLRTPSDKSKVWDDLRAARRLLNAS